MTSALTSDSDEYGGRVAAESGDRSDAAQRQAVVIGTDGQTIGGSFGLVHHQPETAGTVQTGRRPRRRELIGDVAIAEKDGQFRRGVSTHARASYATWNGFVECHLFQWLTKNRSKSNVAYVENRLFDLF